MNARSKLTLLITVVGSFAALFFSAVTLWEMLDKQLTLVDVQLKDLSKWALMVSEMVEAQTSEIQTRLKHLPYWITISETASGKVLYRSNQAQHFELPHLPPHKGMLRHVPVPDNLGIKRDNEGCADFRARCMVSHSGKLRICVACSLDNMQKKFWKDVRGISIGFATFVMVLLGTSYMAARLILRPLAVFNQQARAISETHLEHRLPLTNKNDEFNTLAITLNKVFARLEYAFQQRKQFIANAAHELKTPLAIMRLILYNTVTDTGSRGRSKLLELSEQVLRMERLVKTLLDLSILEASEEIQSERINLCKLLTTLSNDYHLLAQNAGIAFYTEIPETLVVSGDTDKLYRAFSNLLDNAVKYNRPGGEIHLTARRAGPYITVMVSNTGPPLPEDELDKLFEPFYRVDKSRARELGGSGLGLPIVKRIVELHNGRITIQGTPEGLTEVQVTLPVA